MKIGILTHHYISNFGAFLQTYALQQAAQALFPKDDVYIINYINLKHSIINTGGWFRVYRHRETPRIWRQKIKLPATFYRAQQQYFKLTRPCFSARGINRLGLDCIIVGSDEVWNFQEPKGNARLKFGYGLDCPRLVAYAPSIGKSDPAQKLPGYIYEGLKRFTALSARDYPTQLFVEKVLGVTPERVLDPTFLSEFPAAPRVVPKGPYILFYYCDRLPGAYFDQILAYAKRMGYAVYGAGECNKRYDLPTVNLTPFEWVRMFREAQMVFTGTFHGAVFSILNQKQFFCYLTNPSRVQKVHALLEELSIPDRIIDPALPLEETLRHVVDYEPVYARIADRKNDSLTYLKRSGGSHE